MTDNPSTEADLLYGVFTFTCPNCGTSWYLPAAGELRTAIQAELDAIPTEEDDPTRDAFHDGAAAAYSWVLSQLAEAAAGPRGEGLSPDPNDPADIDAELDAELGTAGIDLAAGPRNEGLDVERLGKAMVATGFWPRGYQAMQRKWPAMVAAEYAALAKASDHD